MNSQFNLEFGMGSQTIIQLDLQELTYLIQIYLSYPFLSPVFYSTFILYYNFIILCSKLRNKKSNMSDKLFTNNEDIQDIGAFYTPIEIVHKICHDSVTDYLCKTLSVEEAASKRKAIEELLKLKEVQPILQLELDNINIR